MQNNKELSFFDLRLLNEMWCNSDKNTHWLFPFSAAWCKTLKPLLFFRVKSMPGNEMSMSRISTFSFPIASCNAVSPYVSWIRDRHAHFLFLALSELARHRGINFHCTWMLTSHLCCKSVFMHFTCCLLTATCRVLQPPLFTALIPAPCDSRNSQTSGWFLLPKQAQRIKINTAIDTAQQLLKASNWTNLFILENRQQQNVKNVERWKSYPNAE